MGTKYKKAPVKRRCDIYQYILGNSAVVSVYRSEVASTNCTLVSQILSLYVWDNKTHLCGTLSEIGMVYCFSQSLLYCAHTHSNTSFLLPNNPPLHPVSCLPQSSTPNLMKTCSTFSHVSYRAFTSPTYHTSGLPTSETPKKNKWPRPQQPKHGSQTTIPR